jgi:DNA polymerase-3 subunit gamma/tau
MSYIVTARKWRPMVFEDVVGQQHVANTLRNALSTNRLAHAFIFSGGRGCGKTTTARILAKAVNCLNPNNFNPCNKCEVCEEINSGRSMDIIEIDGASTNSVDDVRSLKEAVRYTPARGKKKIYIIDEVHMLSKGAFNALLKTLEEPPPHVLFIFATTEIQKVPSTIISRCQRYDFRRISVDDIKGRLRYIADQEKFSIDDDSLIIIAKKGDGSMRDAQSIFDQILSYCGTTITARQVIEALNIVDQEFFFRVTDVIRAHDTPAGLGLVDEVVRNGYDIKEFVSGLSEHLRNLLIVKTTQKVSLIETSEHHRARYLADAQQYGENDILRLIRISGELEQAIRYSVQPRFALEVSIVQMTKMTPSVKIDELLLQIESLKKKLYNSPRSTEQSHTAAPITNTGTPNIPPEPIRSPKISAPLNNPFDSVQKNEPQKKDEKKEEEKKTEETAPVFAVKIPIDRVKQEWDLIVEEVRKSKISVGAILAESTPVEVTETALHIVCKDDFHCSTIQRNITFLTQLINTRLESKLRLHPFIQTVSPNPSAAPLQVKPEISAPSVEPSDKVNSTSGVQNQKTEENPIIQLLYTEFGVEKL